MFLLTLKFLIHQYNFHLYASSCHSYINPSGDCVLSFVDIINLIGLIPTMMSSQTLSYLLTSSLWLIRFVPVFSFHGCVVTSFSGRFFVAVPSATLFLLWTNFPRTFSVFGVFWQNADECLYVRSTGWLGNSSLGTMLLHDYCHAPLHL